MTAFVPLTLNTERLTLRFIGDADSAALFQIFSDPEAMRYWSSSAWLHPSQADDNIEQTRKGYLDGDSLRLGVTLSATGELIGTVTLYAFDWRNHRCDIGYMLSRQHWGKGYMPEALAALIEHGFSALQLHRIEADIHPANQASANILKRLHFREEGHLRERWFVNNEISDSLIYGLLRSDWDAARR
jgi:RimJ/RimL family protein N-acetyltransferase